MVERDDRRSARPCRCSRALSLRGGRRRAARSRVKSRSQLAGIVRPMTMATPNVASPMRTNSAGVETRNACSTAMTMVPADHEGGVEHVDAGDDAGAPVGAGPGLHRGEGRHDEQAAGDGETGEIDRHAQAAARREHVADAGRRRSRAARRRWPSRDRARTAPSSTAPTSVGRITMRPAESQAARPEPTATAIENIARNAVTTSSLPPITVLTSGGSSDSTTMPTSQNQLVTSAPHHSRRSARRWRSSRRGGGDDVERDLQIAARPRRPRG